MKIETFWYCVLPSSMGALTSVWSFNMQKAYNVSTTFALPSYSELFETQAVTEIQSYSRGKKLTAD
jgi:hypothetical protein